MTSEKQIKANQQNARKRTGPRTQEGKDRASNNSVKHGLLSQDVLIRGEDGAALQELSERLREELKPVGELEDMLLDRIVAAHWRLRRLGLVEAGLFVNQGSEMPSYARPDLGADTAVLGLSLVIIP